MATMRERLTATVYGRVQGVSFRYHTRRKALELGIVGRVRNQPDGSVHVLAEGDHDVLERFASFLQQGPPAARVSRVESAWGVASGQFDAFEISW
jgi:acylphosphatase